MVNAKRKRTKLFVETGQSIQCPTLNRKQHCFFICKIRNSKLLHVSRFDWPDFVGKKIARRDVAHLKGLYVVCGGSI